MADRQKPAHRPHDDLPEGLAEQLASDRHRPQYHFLPPANWMNDPNGPIYFEGRYHLFYQYHPDDASAGTKHWGHAASEDLVHWDDLPIALSPTPGGPDADGCYTGCAVVDDDGLPTLVYTGVRPEVQCLAQSTDGMVTWQKHPGNPVIGEPPPGLEVVGFRDPCVWKEGETWFQIIGSGIKGVGGAALLYRSADLLHWEYMRPLCVGEEQRTGTMWECPDFFELGDRHVLLVSALGKNLYFSGTYSDHEFRPEVEGLIDFGSSFYAGKTMLAPDGRRILWGWLREERSREAQMEAGWSGAMSLPLVLSMRTDGTLGIEPAAELTALRAEHAGHRDLVVSPTADLVLEDVVGDCLEIVAEVAVRPGAEFGIKVHRPLEGEEETVVLYDSRKGRISLDTGSASLDPDLSPSAQGGPLELAEGEPLRLRIFLDRSIVGVFANGRACVTRRMYPTRADSLGIALTVRGASATVTSLDAWQMHSIW